MTVDVDRREEERGERREERGDSVLGK